MILIKKKNMFRCSLVYCSPLKSTTELDGERQRWPCGFEAIFEEEGDVGWLREWVKTLRVVEEDAVGVRPKPTLVGENSYLIQNPKSRFWWRGTLIRLENLPLVYVQSPVVPFMVWVGVFDVGFVGLLSPKKLSNSLSLSLSHISPCVSRLQWI